jgi:hypothetical protein
MVNYLATLTQHALQQLGKGGKKMAVRIRTRNEIYRGERHVRIIYVHALEIEDLPRRYTDADDKGKKKVSVWMTSEDGCRQLHLQHNCPEYTDFGLTWSYIERGDVIKERAFNNIARYVQTAVDRLNRINKELEVENAEWHGESTQVFY